MDVERTIESLLEHGAKVDTRLGALTKLVQKGMELLIDQGTKINMLLDAQMRTEAAQARTEARLEQLAEAQRVTELKFQAFVDSHRRPNGGSR